MSPEVGARGRSVVRYAASSKTSSQAIRVRLGGILRSQVEGLGEVQARSNPSASGTASAAPPPLRRSASFSSAVAAFCRSSTYRRAGAGDRDTLTCAPKKVRAEKSARRPGRQVQRFEIGLHRIVVGELPAAGTTRAPAAAGAKGSSAGCSVVTVAAPPSLPAQHHKTPATAAQTAARRPNAPTVPASVLVALHRGPCRCRVSLRSGKRLRMPRHCAWTLRPRSGLYADLPQAVPVRAGAGGNRLRSSRPGHQRTWWSFRSLERHGGFGDRQSRKVRLLPRTAGTCSSSARRAAFDYSIQFPLTFYSPFYLLLLLLLLFTLFNYC